MSINRGSNNEGDTGNNDTFYLKTGTWYRTLSPDYSNLNKVYLIDIGSIGRIHYSWCDNIGGVRIFRVMLLTIMAEVGLIKIMLEKTKIIIYTLLHGLELVPRIFFQMIPMFIHSI